MSNNEQEPIFTDEDDDDYVIEIVDDIIDDLFFDRFYEDTDFEYEMMDDNMFEDREIKSKIIIKHNPYKLNISSIQRIYSISQGGLDYISDLIYTKLYNVIGKSMIFMDERGGKILDYIDICHSEKLIYVVNYKNNKNKNIIHYISKILKNVSTSYCITYSAKIQMNDILLAITKTIICQSIRLLEITNKTTLNIRTIVNAVRIIFSDGIVSNILHVGDNAIKLNTTSEFKANLIIPVPFFKNFIHKHAPSYMKLSAKYPVYLSAIIEYIAAEILDLATTQCYKEKHVRITPNDIYQGISHDNDLYTLMNINNIVLLGYNGVDMFSKAPFKQMVRNICIELDDDPIKISKQTFSLLQYYIEYYIYQVLEKTNKLCIYSNKNKISQRDLEFVVDEIKIFYLL